MQRGLEVNHSLYLSHFNKTSNSSTVSKNTQVKNFMKIRPVRAQLFNVDGQTRRS
jgi:hypothetical protein